MFSFSRAKSGGGSVAHCFCTVKLFLGIVGSSSKLWFIFSYSGLLFQSFSFELLLLLYHQSSGSLPFVALMTKITKILSFWKWKQLMFAANQTNPDNTSPQHTLLLKMQMRIQITRNTSLVSSLSVSFFPLNSSSVFVHSSFRFTLASYCAGLAKIIH